MPAGQRLHPGSHPGFSAGEDVEGLVITFPKLDLSLVRRRLVIHDLKIRYDTRTAPATSASRPMFPESRSRGRPGGRDLAPASAPRRGAAFKAGAEPLQGNGRYAVSQGSRSPCLRGGRAGPGEYPTRSPPRSLRSTAWSTISSPSGCRTIFARPVSTWWQRTTPRSSPPAGREAQDFPRFHRGPVASDPRHSARQHRPSGLRIGLSLRRLAFSPDYRPARFAPHRRPWSVQLDPSDTTVEFSSLRTIPRPTADKRSTSADSSGGIGTELFARQHRLSDAPPDSAFFAQPGRRTRVRVSLKGMKGSGVEAAALPGSRRWYTGSRSIRIRSMP